MTRTRRTALRMAFVVAMGSAVWCAWALPHAGSLALGGAVVVLLAACAHVVGSRHMGLYAVGAALMLIALVVGLAHGPLTDTSAASLCLSIFSPDVATAETFQPVADRCQAVRRQHGTVIAVLGGMGTVVMLTALRPPRRGHAVDAA